MTLSDSNFFLVMGVGIAVVPFVVIIISSIIKRWFYD